MSSPSSQNLLPLDFNGNGSSEYLMWNGHKTMRVYGRAGIQTYWVVDALHDKMTLTEYVLGPNGEYEAGAHTDELTPTTSTAQTSISLMRATAAVEISRDRERFQRWLEDDVLAAPEARSTR